MVKTLETGIKMTIELIKTFGAIAASIIAVGSLLASFWWIVRKIVKIAEAVEQLKPNGGKTISDKVNYITKSVDTLNERVGKLELFDTELIPIIQDMKNNKKRGLR